MIDKGSDRLNDRHNFCHAPTYILFKMSNLAREWRIPFPCRQIRASLRLEKAAVEVIGFRLSARVLQDMASFSTGRKIQCRKGNAGDRLEEK